MAANANECTIHIVSEGEGEGEGDEGEGEGEGEEGCTTDADCAPDQFCELRSACPPCAEPADGSDPVCDVACTVEGVCVDRGADPCANIDCGPGFVCVDDGGQAFCEPVNNGDCRADSDCGPNAFCDFSQCGGNGGGAAPPPDCDPSGNNCSDDRPAPACDFGVCVEIQNPSCLDVFCGDGFHCIESDFGAQCVPDGQECNADFDCGPGFHCETFCAADPNCPNCDVCQIEGQCVPDQCPELCGPGQQCVIGADGSFSCTDPVPNCTSDTDCGDGGTCNAADVCLPDPRCNIANPGGIVACSTDCWGFCSNPNTGDCSADSDCQAGEVCLVTEQCQACDPATGQACSDVCTVVGTCVVQDPPPPPADCNVDSDCRDGQVCAVVTDCAPCNDPSGQNCFAPCTTRGQCVDAGTGGGGCDANGNCQP